MDLVVLGVYLLFFVSLLGGANAERVMFTQLVHRHGSRSPLNVRKWCQSAPCGNLNPEGRKMLFQLGRSLRHRYTVEFPTSYFNKIVDDRFDFTVMSTRTTDVPRAIESAEAMVRGMFPSNNTLPVIETFAGDGRDRLLVVNGNPAYYLPLVANISDYHRSLLPLVEQQFPNITLLYAIADEASLSCANKASPACAVDLADLGLCLVSSGNISSLPLLEKNLEKLIKINAAYSKLIWNFDRNLTSDRIRGSPGQGLAQAMRRQMQARINGTRPASAPPILHYSGHDSTITPFSVTLMPVPDERSFMPPFGETLILDLVEDSGNYYVRGSRASPNQTFASNHTYVFEPFAIGGISLNGAIYPANAGELIPVDDFYRFLDSTAPTSGTAGLCYVDDETRRALGCDEFTVNCNTQKACCSFRVACGSAACPKGYFLKDLDSLECVKLGHATINDSDIKMSTALGAAAVTAFVGVLIGSVVMWKVGKIAMAESSFTSSAVPSRSESLLRG